MQLELVSPIFINGRLGKLNEDHISLLFYQKAFINRGVQIELSECRQLKFALSTTNFMIFHVFLADFRRGKG